MKNLTLFIGTLLIFLSCDSEVIETETSIVGTWQLVEIYDGTLSPSQTVEDGYWYEFSSDSTFSSNKWCGNNEIIDGVFSLSRFPSLEIITLRYSCEYDTGTLDWVFEMEYFFENDRMIIRPKNPASDEGCHEEFKKNSN